MNDFKNALGEIKASDQLLFKTKREMLKLDENIGKSRKNFKLALAAMSLLLLLCISGAFVYLNPVSTISIDVNPSVELGLNVFDRVVKTTAFNEDGRLITENINLWNLSYEEAIDKLVSDKSFKEYLREDSYLLITVAAEDNTKYVSTIESAKVINKIKDSGAEMGIAETVSDVTAEAHSCGFSVGKYNAFLALKALDETVTEDEIKAMTMGEIMNMIEALGGDFEYSAIQGSGHGYKGGTNSDGEEESTATQHKGNEEAYKWGSQIENQGKGTGEKGKQGDGDKEEANQVREITDNGNQGNGNLGEDNRNGKGKGNN